MPYIIHIIGTNGKGSTGRLLSCFLDQQNKKVLHYSSPHILKFNERIWIQGRDSFDSELDFAHEKLQNILPKSYIEKLTYFEYTTLLALYLSNNMDYLVLEAGLGGEFDATNVVTNNLSLITTIGLDHQNFLGDTIEQITQTKVRSCDNSYILGYQVYKQVQNEASKILKDKKQIEFKSFELDEEVKKLPSYLKNNLFLALSALDYLEFPTKNYKLPKLKGRFEKLSSNIIIDVGHNPLAASEIAKQLKKENKKVILIYNSYEDKDYEKVLEILKPYLKELQIIDIKDNRIVKKNILSLKAKALGLNIKSFDIINITMDDYYLVFGSFLVVEKFLKDYNKK